MEYLPLCGICNKNPIDTINVKTRKIDWCLPCVEVLRRDGKAKKYNVFLADLVPLIQQGSFAVDTLVHCKIYGFASLLNFAVRFRLVDLIDELLSGPYKTKELGLNFCTRQTILQLAVCGVNGFGLDYTKSLIDRLVDHGAHVAIKEAYKSPLYYAFGLSDFVHVKTIAEHLFDKGCNIPYPQHCVLLQVRDKMDVLSWIAETLADKFDSIQSTLCKYYKLYYKDSPDKKTSFEPFLNSLTSECITSATNAPHSNNFLNNAIKRVPNLYKLLLLINGFDRFDAIRYSPELYHKTLSALLWNHQADSDRVPAVLTRLIELGFKFDFGILQGAILHPSCKGRLALKIIAAKQPDFDWNGANGHSLYKKGTLPLWEAPEKTARLMLKHGARPNYQFAQNKLHSRNTAAFLAIDSSFNDCIDFPKIITLLTFGLRVNPDDMCQKYYTNFMKSPIVQHWTKWRTTRPQSLFLLAFDRAHQEMLVFADWRKALGECLAEQVLNKRYCALKQQAKESLLFVWRAQSLLAQSDNKLHQRFSVVE